MRKVKDKAFAEEGAAIGHNTAEADKKCVEKVMAIEAKRRSLSGEIKDILNKHKNDHGTPKGSIRKAVKLLEMTEEQYQAKKEVEMQARAIVQLFADEDGQYSFLSSQEAA